MPKKAKTTQTKKKQTKKSTRKVAKTTKKKVTKKAETKRKASAKKTKASKTTAKKVKTTKVKAKSKAKAPATQKRKEKEKPSKKAIAEAAAKKTEDPKEKAEAAPAAADAKTGKNGKNGKKKENYDPHDETDLDVSSLYFRDISEYRILTAGEEKSAFEEMEKILREAWRNALEIPQVHPEFANLIKDVLKANLGRIHEAARTYAAREGDPEVQKILRAKAPGMFHNRNRFSTTLMRIDPDLIILDGVILSFTRIQQKGKAAKERDNRYFEEEKPSYTMLRKSLLARDLEKLRERLRYVRRFRLLITKKRNAFLAANLKLVISVAKKYRGHSLTFDDMIQEGNMGLMTAIGRFDHRLGYKFSTYATWWIRQSITRALSVKDRTIRLPVHLHEIYYRVRRVTAELKEKLGRNPTPEEVAEASSLRPDQIKDYSHLFVEPESLDAGHDSDDDRTLGEFIPDGELVPSDEAAEHFRLSEEIKDLLKSLTPREEDILRRRFGIGQNRDYTLQEIAERYHLTRERIRQIEAKGLEKLRRPNRKRKLEEYNRELAG